MSTTERLDLSEFAEANEAKVPWDERARMIRRRFPSTAALDWKRAFDADPELFGRLVRDMLKINAGAPGRPGPRPALSEEDAARRYRQLTGQDYTFLPFPEAFGHLRAGRSIRHLARKVGLDRNQVFRLLNGSVEPAAYDMEQVARAFSLDPSYFVEWRMLAITAALAGRMAEAPEATVGLYRRLKAASSQ